MREAPRVERLLVAKLRGFCAGVVRAVDVVERAIELCGRPLFVRREIVHNSRVVADLEAKGAVFVTELAEVPIGSWVVFSAHGISPEVREQARSRGLKTIDATCPLVTKVHMELLHYARRGYTVLFVGHDGHDETAGTLGEAPLATRLIETLADARAVAVPDPERVAVLTQTTLSVDDTKAILSELRRRFPALTMPSKDDICYATTNRQEAVKALARHAELILVLGAPNSSNSLRLVEVARSRGRRAHLIERAEDIRPEWLEGVRTAGLTASASAPETLVVETVAWFKERCGTAEVRELETVEEDVSFPLPSELALLSEGAAAARAERSEPAPGLLSPGERAPADAGETALAAKRSGAASA